MYQKRCINISVSSTSQDIVSNEAIKLELMFKYSLINDVIKVRGNNVANNN